ncbi:MAG: serine hydrolase [Phenylobacterium sp.]|uniref:serine hydrolase domain-containing protein n=1 Tax=Phenylobacterium sp. TaxID=1871053 RepID=UPI002727E77C|nr:serine hydrolase [Phenylobacterium sp.]MDO8411478.1 serine hydrolase [Phenylobacterium sp.]
MNDLLTYLKHQNSTGFIVILDGQMLVHEAWPAPQDDQVFANLTYGLTAEGVLLEDVASQQKSFIAVLVGVAVDKELLDVDAPVSRYLGEGWSKASADQEAKIRVIDLLIMSSGLDEQFAYVAPAGSAFLYNTPVYAITKDILTAAAGQPLETLTQDWLTTPLGMSQTAWRKRPAALASVGNATGLVTTPQDVARFGLMILNNGLAEDGTRIISQGQLDALFQPSDANPAYGRLWWLNGGDYVIRAQGGRAEGPLIPTAPDDLVGAFGALDRRLYVVPSRRLVVVRTGAAAVDPNFDQELWRRLTDVLG